MTAPEQPALTPEQLAAVRTYATAAALNYHDAQVPEGDRVDLCAAWIVHQDLRLVAADVLEAAALKASSVAAVDSAGNVKRVKVEGEVEAEFFASTAVDSVTAAAWSAKAAQLRTQAEQAAITRRPRAGIRLSGGGAPAFRRSDVVRDEYPCREDV